MASITLVVTSSGLPGHTAVQITKGGETTYLGLGPTKALLPYTEVGQYDIITLPNGVSPVGALHGPFPSTNPNVNGEYHYVDLLHYPNTKSFTWQISDDQAAAAIDKAFSYQASSVSYNFFNATICSDFGLKILETAIPGSNLGLLNRIPSILAGQLGEVVANGTFIFGGPAGVAVNPGLSGIQQDSAPPNFNVLQQFNDLVPFNYAGGTLETDGAPPPMKV